MSSIKDILKASNLFSADSQRSAIFRATLIGMVAGSAALLLEWGAYCINFMRLKFCNYYPALIVLPLAGLIGGLVSGFLVQKYSPTAYGSGIPQVRAYLLGARQPLDFKLALVKLLAGVIALGSGLVMGREGPTVHVGAAIAAQMNQWFSAAKEQHKQLVAAGAGAGLAAAFNAPVAGVLFVVEELLKDVSTNTIGTAILACFVASAITHIFNAPHVQATHQFQAMELQFELHDVLFWVLLGILAGVFGTLFNRAVVFFLKLYRQYIKMPVALSVGLAGMISGFIIALFPVNEHFRNFSVLTDLFIAGQTDWLTALLAFVAFFFLTVLAYGSGAPGGLFAPSLVLGAALGLLVASFEKLAFGVGSEQILAMVGMGAFFAAVARVPITAVVIITEITRHYNIVPALMVATAIACLVGSRIDKDSVYDKLREYSGLDEEIRRLKEMESQPLAKDLMRPLKTRLRIDSSTEELVDAIKHVHAHKLPVFEDDKFVGLLDTAALLKGSEIILPQDLKISELIDKGARTVSTDATMREVLEIFKQGGDCTLAVTEGIELIGLIHKEDMSVRERNSNN